MRIGLLPFALSLFLVAGAAGADVLVLPEGEPVPEIRLPAKGSSMAEVEKNYGAPRVKRPTVGGTSPQQPPITRWDYDGFAVIFERDRMIDGVIPGAPPRIYNRGGLETVVVPMMPAASPDSPAPDEWQPETPVEPAPWPQPEPAPDSSYAPAQ